MRTGGAQRERWRAKNAGRTLGQNRQSVKTFPHPHRACWQSRRVAISSHASPRAMPIRTGRDRARFGGGRGTSASPAGVKHEVRGVRSQDRCALASASARSVAAQERRPAPTVPNPHSPQPSQPPAPTVPSPRGGRGQDFEAAGWASGNSRGRSVLRSRWGFAGGPPEVDLVAEVGNAVGVTRGEVELFEGVLAEVVQLGRLVAALEENQFPVAVADPAMSQVEGWLLERAGCVFKDLAKDLGAGQGGFPRGQTGAG